MNSFLWILQTLLALVFIASGSIILLLPKAKLAPKLSWVKNYSPQKVILICLAKMAGGIGLVLPMYLQILPVLTPLAAAGLAIIMAMAFAYHIQQREYKDLPPTILFFLMLLTIAWFRY
jgi:uncharacterized membrane protein YphA (DoxX/SURF4 family)